MDASPQSMSILDDIAASDDLRRGFARPTTTLQEGFGPLARVRSRDDNPPEGTAKAPPASTSGAGSRDRRRLSRKPLPPWRESGHVMITPRKTRPRHRLLRLPARVLATDDDAQGFSRHSNRTVSVIVMGKCGSPAPEASAATPTAPPR